MSLHRGEGFSGLMRVNFFCVLEFAFVFQFEYLFRPELAWSLILSAPSARPSLILTNVHRPFQYRGTVPP
jgi:hypothetical protein